MNKNITMGKVSIITWIQLRAFWAGGLISFQPPLSTVQPNECQSESGEDNALGRRAFHYSCPHLLPSGLRLCLWQACLTVHKLIHSKAVQVHLHCYTCNVCCINWLTAEALLFFFFFSLFLFIAAHRACTDLAWAQLWEEWKGAQQIYMLLILTKAYMQSFFLVP